MVTTGDISNFSNNNIKTTRDHCICVSYTVGNVKKKETNDTQHLIYTVSIDFYIFTTLVHDCTNIF